MDMSKWFNFYSFDVMGDLGFNTSFHMLDSGETHWAIKLLNEGMDPIGAQLPTWFFRLLIAIPGAAGDFWKFIKYCSDQLEARMQVQGKMENPDITHTLIDYYNRSDKAAQKAQIPMLQGDSRLIIVAGSDTTASTLVHLFYHLATEKGLIERLREEVDSLTKGDDKIEHQKLQDAPLLNGAINETLRLHPPVPSGLFRKAPSEGVEIGDVYIPGNTKIQMPQYAMARGEFTESRIQPLLSSPSVVAANGHTQTRTSMNIRNPSFPNASALDRSWSITKTHSPPSASGRTAASARTSGTWRSACLRPS